MWAIVVAGLAAFVCISPTSAKQTTREIAAFGKSIGIPGAKRVGSETCATCHADVAKNFQHAYHAQQGVQCEDCHGNGSLHVDGGGDTSKIFRFQKSSSADANGACLTCHAQDKGTRHWQSGIHAANGVRCTDCHEIHASSVNTAHGATRFDTTTSGALRVASISPETNPMVQSRSVTNEACLKCHQTEKAQLSMPYHHPLREGKMSCVDCHDAHGGRAGNNLRTANVNELCLSCHAQYRGPFAYQHPSVTESCLNCHTPHGSPNTNLLTLSEPALCLQCHAGHHNGANLPLVERCTNCHDSIHGTDVATLSGGSRFIDKGPIGLPYDATGPGPTGATAFSNATPDTSAATIAAAGGVMGLLTSRHAHAVQRGQGAVNQGTGAAEVTAGAGAPLASSSISSASYRFLDGTGFQSRVGEYDSLQQSAGTVSMTSYVSPTKHLTLVSRSRVLTGDDYSMQTQLTIGKWMKGGLDLRSLVQEQDHYKSYLAQLSPADFGLPGAVTDLIPANATFGVTRRLGNGYARIQVPKVPVLLFVKGDMQARVGNTQLTYLDENSTPAVYVDGVNTTCGQLCHQVSKYQPVNYTTRNVGGGVTIHLNHLLLLTYEHDFSSFNDRLPFPTATYTGPSTPENEGFSPINPPPSGPAPTDFPAGNYYLNIPSPNQTSTDTVNLNATPSEMFSFNGHVSYTRLRNTYTQNPQNWFDSDETLNWLAMKRIRLIADYHQQNLINDFTPYYSLYGNVSFHRHWEGLKVEADLPAGLHADASYRRSGITRSNAFLWPQIYSMDNTDLQTVIPSSTSNTGSLDLRYRNHLVSARVGDEWTKTQHPGYLIVPEDQNRTFADIWFTPTHWLTFVNNTNIVVQNSFPNDPLPDSPNLTSQGFGQDISGLPPVFQRRDRFYTEAANVSLQLVQDWDIAAGYSYQQDDLTSYMAFQNDSSVGYIVDQANVPYKQLSQVYWGDSTYTLKQRLGIDLRLTHNASSSSFRPDQNPNDASGMGNAALIQQGLFDPSLFQQALGNVELGATQVSGVKVPQWIGQGKAYYHLPYKFEGGVVLYYGSYRDHWNPNLNGVLRTFDIYLGRTW
jgi:predicted CXXCH cytochrome family protein